MAVAPIAGIMQAFLDARVAAGLEAIQFGGLSYRRSVVGAEGDLVAVLTYRTPAGTCAALVQACRGCWTVTLGLEVREAVRRARLIALPLFSIEGGNHDHAAAAV